MNQEVHEVRKGGVGHNEVVDATVVMTPAGLQIADATPMTLREMQREMGQRWLAEHPVMDSPDGFELYPEGVGSFDEDEIDGRSGWFLTGKESNPVWSFMEFDADAALVRLHADDERVIRIELWRGTDCVWVAKRAGE